MAGPVYTALLRLFLSSLPLILSLLSTLVHGQGDIVFQSYAVHSRVGSKLYAVGGGFSEEVFNASRSAAITTSSITVGDGQTIVLDLSVSWDAAKPAWKRLKNGPKQMDFTGTLNADGTKFITFRSGGSSYAMIYDVAKDTWASSGVTVVQPDRLGISAVTDPTTNKVYLPFGEQMQIYDFKTDKMTNISMATSPLSKTMYMEGVWWSERQSILYFGGFTYPDGAQTSAPNVLYMYTPSTDSWSTPVTKGTAPTSRSNMCVVISDDGNTLVLFGGRVILNAGYQIISAEIYVLDLNTMVWTRGKDYTSPRMYSVCTLYNGTFFSWGGSDARQNVAAPMIIYDVKRNLYLNKYPINPETDSGPKDAGPKDAGPEDAGPKDEGTSEPDTSNTRPDSDSLSTGAFIGIFLAAALSTAFVVWAIRYSTLKRNNRSNKNDSGDDGASGYDDAPPSPSGGMSVATHSNSSSQFYHKGYQHFVPPNVHSPHMTVSRNSPQEHGYTPPAGYMMTSTIRGPEATPITVEHRPVKPDPSMLENLQSPPHVLLRRIP